MKTLTIEWLNKCRCGNKLHTVKTARGNESALWDDDAVKCDSCGRGGVIQVCEGQARVLWETDEEMAEGKPMSTITKEQAQSVSDLKAGYTLGHADVAILNELARIALASLEAEPVGEVSEQRDGLVMDGTVDLGGASTHRIIKGASKMKRLPLGTKFYTAPPAPVSVPAAMEMDDDFDSAFEHGKAVGWNAYRAAMLQSFGNSEQLNSPVIPDGWVMVPVDMPHEMMRAVQVNSELGAYAATNLNGAYSLFREFWDVAVTAAPQQEMNT